MLSHIVGPVDWPAAIVLAGLFIGIGICFIFYFTTRRTKEDYEIEKMKEINQHALFMAREEKKQITAYKEE